MPSDIRSAHFFKLVPRRFPTLPELKARMTQLALLPIQISCLRKGRHPFIPIFQKPLAQSRAKTWYILNKLSQSTQPLRNPSGISAGEPATTGHTKLHNNNCSIQMWLLFFLFLLCEIFPRFFTKLPCLLFHLTHFSFS